MAVQNATVDSSVTFVQRDINNSTNVVDNSSMQFRYVFGSGATSGTVNSAYYTTGVISGGSSNTFDLFSLNRTIFGSTLNTSMSGGRVKVLIIENLSLNSGYNMRLLATGTPDFPSLLGVTGALIPAESNLLFTNKIGYIIGSSRFIRLVDVGGSGINYELIILGSV